MLSATLKIQAQKADENDIKELEASYKALQKIKKNNINKHDAYSLNSQCFLAMLSKPRSHTKLNTTH